MKKWILLAIVATSAAALCFWQPKRHDTTLVVQPRPCIDKHSKEGPNGTIEDGQICTDTLVWHEEPRQSPKPQRMGRCGKKGC